MYTQGIWVRIPQSLEKHWVFPTLYREGTWNSSLDWKPKGAGVGLTLIFVTISYFLPLKEDCHALVLHKGHLPRLFFLSSKVCCFLHLNHPSRALKYPPWGLILLVILPRSPGLCFRGCKSAAHGPKSLPAKHWAQLSPGTLFTWWHNWNVGSLFRWIQNPSTFRCTREWFSTSPGLAPWSRYHMPSCVVLSPKYETS